MGLAPVPSLPPLTCAVCVWVASLLIASFASNGPPAAAPRLPLCFCLSLSVCVYLCMHNRWPLMYHLMLSPAPGSCYSKGHRIRAGEDTGRRHVEVTRRSQPVSFPWDGGGKKTDRFMHRKVPPPRKDLPIPAGQGWSLALARLGIAPRVAYKPAPVARHNRHLLGFWLRPLENSRLERGEKKEYAPSCRHPRVSRFSRGVLRLLLLFQVPALALTARERCNSGSFAGKDR